MRQLGQLDQLGLTMAETHLAITRALDSEKPFFVGRPGGTESEGMRFFVEKRLASKNPTPPAYSKWFKEFVQRGPGVTHFSDSDLDLFCEHYLAATLESDLLAYGRFAPGAVGIAKRASETGKVVTDFSHLEPLFALEQNIAPWTLALEGKKVLVVHPFEASIREQFERRLEVTNLTKILPDFDLDTLVPPVTFAGETSDVPWHETFTDLARRAMAKDFNTAIIGAGGYGLPLAHAIKQAGRQAIHLGGTTQLLFGIRGKRWDNDPQFSCFFDDTWVRPRPEETPQGKELVEGGIYW
jgi:hypothetical protein